MVEIEVFDETSDEAKVEITEFRELNEAIKLLGPVSEMVLKPKADYFHDHDDIYINGFLVVEEKGHHWIWVVGVLLHRFSNEDQIEYDSRILKVRKDLKKLVKKAELKIEE